MVIKIWSIKTPLLGGVILASAWSQVAGAAELPISQTALLIPGIPTPDQAVRRMANDVVLDSRSAAALTGSTKSRSIGADRLAPRQISAVPNSVKLSEPTRVLSSCPTNVCGLVATQPPVTLGTASASGINKAEQNKLTNFISTTTTPLQVTPLQVGKTTTSPATTPGEQIANNARVALSIEPGLSKDVAFGQPAHNLTKTERKIEVQAATNQPTTPPTVAKFTTADKAIDIGNVTNQVTSFTGQLVANSWKLITVLPKPQLDYSLLNISAGRPFQNSDSLSFSPRLTLGTVVKPNLLTKASSSLNASPLFATQGLGRNPVMQWSQSDFFGKPWNQSNSQPEEFGVYKGLANINNTETSAKPFVIRNFLATLNTSTWSLQKSGGQNY